MGISCRTCGEEFNDFRELVLHRQHDNCREKVKEHQRIYKIKAYDQHQKDLTEFADWGE